MFSLKQKNIVLASGQCGWGRCMFCGFGRLKTKPLSYDNLKKQIDNQFKNINNIDRLGIYISGSMLDPNQVPPSIRKYIVKKCKEKNVKELQIESRPEFVSKESLRDFKGIKLTLAIGLEIADDFILKKLKKGFKVSDYEVACTVAKSLGVKIKTYILVNPPYVKPPKESLDETVNFALNYSDKIVLINCYPHKDTPLEKLYNEGKWKPLNKSKFFDITKDWLVYPNIDYEIKQKGAAPLWKAWVPKFERKDNIKGVGEKQLRHPHFEVWQDFLDKKFKVPEEKKYALFLPCSYIKPYTKSKLHRNIYKELKKLNDFDKIHRIVISSPGVVPIEFSNYYPFNSYDWPPWKETKEIKEKYIEVTKKRIKDYLSNHKKSYKKIFSYFSHDAESYIALQRACEDLGIELHNLLSKQVYNKIKDKKNPLADKYAINLMTRKLKKET